MKSADYQIVRETPDIIFIEDLDLGNRSITNDAEEVVETLLFLSGRKRIVYKDSMGQWDELVHDGEKFTGFAPYKGELPCR